VGWAVLLNNIESLLILLDCGYVKATCLALAGVTARWLVEGMVLTIVGIQFESGPVGDIWEMTRNVGSMIAEIGARHG
jgi:hypothetical protein